MNDNFIFNETDLGKISSFASIIGPLMIVVGSYLLVIGFDNKTSFQFFIVGVMILIITMLINFLYWKFVNNSKLTKYKLIYSISYTLTSTLISMLLMCFLSVLLLKKFLIDMGINISILLIFSCVMIVLSIAFGSLGFVFSKKAKAEFEFIEQRKEKKEGKFIYEVTIDQEYSMSKKLKDLLDQTIKEETSCNIITSKLTPGEEHYEKE